MSGLTYQCQRKGCNATCQAKTTTDTLALLGLCAACQEKRLDDIRNPKGKRQQ